MNAAVTKPGALMAAEIAEAPVVFSRTVLGDHSEAVSRLNPDSWRAIYTIARGSSDAVANILSYLYMSHLKIPVTSLPPSTFSVYDGVAMTGAAGLVISQSGASDDLVACAGGIRSAGGRVLALTNQPSSPVEAAADLTIPIGAGPERAVPATKSVVGSIAAGMALLAAINPAYGERLAPAAQAMAALADYDLAEHSQLQSALLRADHVFVVGRGAGYGAAQEIALKLKETAALHAEAYSASEVLHGPLQLATNPLFVLILDTGEPESQTSVDKAEERFRASGGEVMRLTPPAAADLCPAAVAAMLLNMLYPLVLDTTLARGLDPDNPSTLSKVTRTS